MESESSIKNGNNKEIFITLLLVNWSINNRLSVGVTIDLLRSLLIYKLF